MTDAAPPVANLLDLTGRVALVTSGSGGIGGRDCPTPGGRPGYDGSSPRTGSTFIQYYVNSEVRSFHAVWRQLDLFWNTMLAAWLPNNSLEPTWPARGLASARY